MFECDVKRRERAPEHDGQTAYGNLTGWRVPVTGFTNPYEANIALGEAIGWGAQPSPVHHALTLADGWYYYTTYYSIGD